MDIYEKTDCFFPRWDDFPDVGLYMDQVVELVNKYLSGIPAFSGSDQQITSSMINNYVKSKTIPAPEKKRYSRKHLAYIMIVCTLKQTFSISVIQNLLASYEGKDCFSEMYNTFADYQQKSYADSVREVINSLDNSDDKHAVVMRLVADVNIKKNIAEQLSRQIIQ